MTSAPRFALGVGLTNACNLACAHCYRATGTDALDVESVLAATRALPTRAVNFGTGENGLHPDFPALVDALVTGGIAVTMTTNGHSAEVLSDATLAKFSDVEFSIDHPSRETHDAARGPGNWDLIERQMARCASLGVRTTVATVLMATNHRALADLARLAARRGAFLRVNVFQAVRTDAFKLSFDEFWGAWEALLAEADMVACGEPILRAVLGIPRTPGAGCGVETVRLTPRGAVVPCVYQSSAAQSRSGGDAELGVHELTQMGASVVDQPQFRELATVPSACRSCPHVSTCGGGCPSRRTLRGSLDEPDEYCPFVRGRRISLQARFVDHPMMHKASSACTTIVRGRLPH